MATATPNTNTKPEPHPNIPYTTTEIFTHYSTAVTNIKPSLNPDRSSNANISTQTFTYVFPLYTTASGRRRGIKPVESNDEFDTDVQKLDELHEVVSEQLERVIRSDPGSSVYLAALSGYGLELSKLEARIWAWREEMERIRGAHGTLRKGLRHWVRG